MIKREYSSFILPLLQNEDIRMQNPPFYYVVSFHFLAQDKNKELIHQNWRREFYHSDPLIARQEAFEELEEYLNFLKQNGKTEKDEYGNFKIISPSGIPKMPEINEEVDHKEFEAMIRAVSEYTEFSEDLDLLIVMTDDKLVDEIGYGDSTLAIHSVSSHSVYKQNMIDNLTTEIKLYQIADKDTSDKAVVVQHYGDDYYESGEDDEAVNYAILPTPYNWTSKEQYLKEEKEAAKENTEEYSPNYDKSTIWENIIAEGETNKVEFKPSLAYNFNTEYPNYIPLYNNAKTLNGFLNSKGGVLLIGLADDGKVHGIQQDLDLLGSKDKIRLK
jgi:hypothetical protein